MRKVIFYHFIMFIIVPSLLTGQNTRIKSTGIEASVSYNYLEDLKLHILFTLTKKQHEPFIGLEFPVGTGHISNYGLNAGYKFFPNKSRQNFDFFFIYLLQAESRKLYSNSTIDGFSLHNLIGYGFNVYLNDKIYIKHHIAAGIESAWFNDYGNFTDFSLMINLGVGIRIKTQKK
ncbi:MAG: hypothetical protein B6D61_11630 [Bacteroidetes bacterium 4484_249]|nr:MAG: hypothetical protein B6D61_11630 [Bacteroidetes bacterium 4484_249]